MKKFTLLLIFTFSISLLSAQNKEEEAIKKVITSETQYWIDADFEGWSTLFVQEPFLLWSVTNLGEPGDVLTKRGWGSLRDMMKKGFEAAAKAPQKPNKTKVSQDQWNVQIRGNTAYVTFNQHTENEEKQINLNSTETRVLEKVKGQWRMVVLNALADFKDATPPIRTKY